jgi:hypothetical protein
MLSIFDQLRIDLDRTIYLGNRGCEAEVYIGRSFVSFGATLPIAPALNSTSAVHFGE